MPACQLRYGAKEMQAALGSGPALGTRPQIRAGGGEMPPVSMVTRDQRVPAGCPAARVATASGPRPGA